MNSGKKILIFGAGENQITLIKAAKDLNVESVVIDPDPDAPGKNFADYFETVGPSDYDLTRQIAQKYKVDGIVTSQMENPLELMARLAKDLGFIFSSPEVIRRCRNKYLMKQSFLQNQIPCANGILVKKGEKMPDEKIKEIGFPLIIKPVDSHSSRGVFCLKSLNELRKLEDETRNFSSDGTLIVEEFIDGPEFSIEAVTYRGETTIIQYTEKIITQYPHTVEIGHLQPARLTSSQKRRIDETVTKGIRALGIDNAASHTELKVTSNGIFIIEIGARLGGDFISSFLTLASTGFNMDKAAIQIALGQKPELAGLKKAYSHIKYVVLEEGKTIKKINHWREILLNEDVLYANIKINEGDVVPKLSDSSKRIGFIIVKGNSRNAVIKKAELYCKLLSEKIILY